MAHDRRTFLKRSGVALSAVALPGCARDGGPGEGETASARLDTSLLSAVGALVLPVELGERGRAGAVAAFERWAEAYDPVPELNHGYGTSEIRFGPADPVPGWQTQLQALDLEAEHRFGSPFTELEPERRMAILSSHVDALEGDALPSPLRARHVAVALLAHWASSPEATDLCYGARIQPQTCRGLAGSADEPVRLP